MVRIQTPLTHPTPGLICSCLVVVRVPVTFLELSTLAASAFGHRFNPHCSQESAGKNSYLSVSSGTVCKLDLGVRDIALPISLRFPESSTPEGLSIDAKFRVRSRASCRAAFCSSSLSVSAIAVFLCSGCCAPMSLLLLFQFSHHIYQVFPALTRS